MKRSLILASWILLAACTAPSQSEPVDVQRPAVTSLPTLDIALVEEGETLYAAYCASCHGIELEGQPDWQMRQVDGSFPAPPHDSTGHTWHHSDKVLLDIIARGGNPALGSKMLGFQDTLSEDQMRAILVFIKSHWGVEEREIQWQISTR